MILSASTLSERRGSSSMDRRHFIGGSDARIVIGDDEGALVRLWREKRGEVAPGGFIEQSHRPAWGGDRRAEPALV